MIKHKHGLNKMLAAKQRRLDRGAAKQKRKTERHRDCTIHAEFGKHNHIKDYDGSDYCVECLRVPRRWF